MSRRLEVRPVDACRPPDYPGRQVEVGRLVRRRYGDSALAQLRRGLTRPLVVFGLFATLQLPAAGDDERPGDPPALHDPQDRERRGEPRVRMLSREEIHGLVSDLARLEEEVEVMIEGRVRGQMGFLTEEEGRALLEALFRKNGYAPARDVRVQGSGLDLVVDGFDAGRRTGFEFVGPRERDAYQFEAAETDLSPAEIAEIEIERARRERAILVLDGANYGYNVRYMGSLPSKAAVVDRLLEDARRFLVWRAGEPR